MKYNILSVFKSFLCAGCIVIMYSCKQKEPLLLGSYPQYIGYLDPETTLYSKEFKLCNTYAIRTTHHGGAPHGYKPNKGIFDKKIREGYQNLGHKDSGYLILRFIVNCRGETGRFEIIQTDVNMEKTVLDSTLVTQLVKLTRAPDNFLEVQKNDTTGLDYYMYISYKLEQGEISEILP